MRRCNHLLIESYPRRLRRMARHQGFTLIELLIVFAIAALLMSLVLPAVNAVREAARRMTCQDRLRQVMVGLTVYEGARARFPNTRSKNPFLHWHFEILPELEQRSLHRSVTSELNSGFDWISLSARRNSISVYQCPSNATSGALHRGIIAGDLFSATHYIGVAGRSYSSADGVFPSWKSGRNFNSGTALREITDGLSNTLAVGERPVNFEPLLGAWLSSQEYGHETLGVSEFEGLEYNTPNHESCPGSTFGPGRMDEYCSQFHHWSLHPSGANFCFADGHLQFLSYSIDQQLLAAMSTKSGHEAIAPQD